MAGSDTSPTETGRFSFESGGFRYMEHVRGCFLATAIGSALLLKRKLSPPLAAFIAAEVANALDYAHHCEDDRGRPLHIIHRAVSPTPIRLGRNGRVKLTNFGAAFSELWGHDLRAYLHSLRRPFGTPEAAAELSDILRRASALERKDAHPVEIGVLPWPKASSLR